MTALNDIEDWEEGFCNKFKTHPQTSNKIMDSETRIESE